MTDEQQFEAILIEEIRKINPEAWESIEDKKVWEFFLRSFDPQPALRVITQAAVRFKKDQYARVHQSERGAGDDYPVIEPSIQTEKSDKHIVDG